MTIQKDQLIEELRAEIDSLRSIIAKMPGNVYWKDINGVFLGCNNNVARVHNLAEPSEIIGKTNLDIMSAEIAEKIQSIDSKIIESGHEQRIEEFGVNNSVYLTHKVPLWDKNNNVQGILGISLDITERKKMEVKLKIAKQKAEAANKAKSEFLAMISHELRTPLAGILGFANLLERDNLTPTNRKDFIKHIQNSGTYLVSLINNLLDYTKLETHKFEMLCAPLDLKVLIQNVISMLRGSANLKDLAMELIYPDNLPTVIFGNEQVLRQIFFNLIGNAIKFTDKGHVTVTVTEIKCTDETIKLKISVEDTGPGIPYREQKKIFKRFYQVGNIYTRNSSLSGTGLGLAIVKKLVRLLGSNIDLRSMPGVGSNFFFTVNFKRAQLDVSPALSQPVPFALSKSPKVLLIEDNELIQIIHKNLLETLGCQVDITDSASQTLKMLPNQYDLLLVDIGLPDIAGFDLIRTIRQKHHVAENIPIVVLTGYSEMENHQHCLNAGANEVLVKPISLETLNKVLANYIPSISIQNDYEATAV